MQVKASLRRIVQKRNSSTAKQFSALFGTNILGIGLGVIVSILNTRLLGPEAYGDLKYLLNLFALGVLVLTGGYSVTGGRAIALHKYEESKEHLIGGLYVINLIIAFLFVTILFTTSYFIDSIVDGNIGYLIRWLSPLLLLFPFYELQARLLEGENRIYELSFYNTAPRVMYIFLLGIVSFFTALSLELALGMHLITLLVVVVVIYLRKAPIYSNIKESLYTLRELNKKHGVHIYIGALFGNGSEYLATISIGYFMTNVSVGYYALATTVATPLLMIPRTLGTVFFKKFANSDRIPGKVFLMTIIISVVVLVLFNLLIEYVVLFVYSAEYLPVIKYTRIMSIAIIIKGFCFFINRFLNSHGLGKELRNAAFARGIINLTGFYLLVKYYDVYGACITNIIANAVVLLFLIMKYYRHIRHTRHT